MLVALLLVIGGLSAGAAALLQQQKPLNVRALQKLGDNLYFISGGDLDEPGRTTWTGGNSLVLVRDAGVVLVDTMLPGAGRGILSQIKSVTDKPVTMIINTHTHYDHTEGNPDFPATAEVVTHENTAKLMPEMRIPYGVTLTDRNVFKDSKGRGLPKRTFSDQMTIGSDSTLRPRQPP